MALKLLLPALRPCGFLPRLQVMSKESSNCPQLVTVRGSSSLIPKSQYDTPLSRKFKFSVLIHNWEIIPLFAVTLTSMALMTFSIIWAIGNKVDVVFASHDRDTLSRTMNLRTPKVHKLLTFNQEYQPWPEVQDALDKMHKVEVKARKAAAAAGCYP